MQPTSVQVAPRLDWHDDGAMTDHVLLEQRPDGVAIVTFNRPDSHNSMSAELMEAFEATIAALSRDAAVRVVVLTGSGRSFCSGADFDALAKLSEATGMSGAMAAQAAVRRVYGAFMCVRQLDVPVIGAINGHAVGGGFGLALLCDIRIMASRAKVGANFARLGIHSGMGIGQLLVDLIGYEAAAEMLFTGELVRGSEAHALGMCRKVVAADEVLPEALGIAERIAAAAPIAVRHMKITLRERRLRGLDAMLQLEAYAQAQLMQTNDAREGIAAMLAKRDPSFEGG